MQTLTVIAFAVSAAWIGMCVGTSIGVSFVPAGSGLAGPAIALGYGVVGAASCLVAALICTRFLDPTKLRRITVITVVFAAATALVAIIRYRQVQPVYYDDEEAYDRLPRFEVSVQQTVILDPGLSTRTAIDTKRRQWEITLPDGRICSGNLRAAVQESVGEALRKLTSLETADLESCRSSTASGEQILAWSLLDNGAGHTDGSLEVSAKCLQGQPVVAQAIRVIKMVSVNHNSKAWCE